jgi:cytochrome c biogenesis protein CcdA/thiol-disulfide isomerase/thioredoxin
MTLFLIAFLAGALTVLAPCILPMLPVVIGSSLMGRSRYTPYIVIASLSVSVIIFTYVLKVSTIFITIPTSFWGYISGAVVALFGLTLVFPTLWDKMPGVRRLSQSSNRLVGEGYRERSFKGDVLIGAALGPVFSTCSPTYFLILATVLPTSFLLGTVYLLAYVAGLALILLLIAYYGDRLTRKLLPLADSHGRAKRIIGIVLIVVGLGIMSGYDKKFETWLIDNGFVFSNFEYKLLESVPMPVESEEEAHVPLGTTIAKAMETATTTPATCARGEGHCTSTKTIADDAIEPVVALTDKQPVLKPAVQTNKNHFIELVSPDGYLNTNGQTITISEQFPDKVVLVAFMTYSCINCQRTFPYLERWYETYKDDGLVVIGIHTPEFAFEHNISAVQAALDKHGITFPVVLDNDYETWRAYGNRYWPRRYLISRDGEVVFDHIGEGAYEETETLIKQHLNQN